ncbi:unnamed protein product [Danaus chrysippus]|uniref:(African queen) hypothetical protein n=1 Tax=Danaus chrysippus TaxID=151541 RepID=A0A8J2RB27_9NEOP|nr:unnamed protein product [Danaus chrysippus]
MAGGASASVGAPQLHLICGSVALCSRRRPARGARAHSAQYTLHRAPLRATRRARGVAVRPPRCMPTRLSTLYSSDTSIQTLKILGSWMYALAYVNCDSFSFPFLVGDRVAGRRRLLPDGAIASISSYISPTRSYHRLRIDS